MTKIEKLTKDEAAVHDEVVLHNVGWARHAINDTAQLFANYFVAEKGWFLPEFIQEREGVVIVDDVLEPEVESVYPLKASDSGEIYELINDEWIKVPEAELPRLVRDLHDLLAYERLVREVRIIRRALELSIDDAYEDEYPSPLAIQELEAALQRFPNEKPFSRGTEGLMALIRGDKDERAKPAGGEQK